MRLPAPALQATRHSPLPFPSPQTEVPSHCGLLDEDACRAEHGDIVAKLKQYGTPDFDAMRGTHQPRRRPPSSEPLLRLPC